MKFKKKIKLVKGNIALAKTFDTNETKQHLS